MPTKIDIALSMGKQDLAASIEKINAGDESQELSPLFRDEVQRHEMRYLDTFLSPENSGDGSSQAKKDNSSLNPAKNVGDTVNSGYESKSRIAQLMGPNRTTANLQETTNGNIEQTEKDCNIQQPNDTETYMSTSHEQEVSNVIKQSPIRPSRHNKRSDKRPTPSKNRRRQFNNRFLQKTKLKSHQIATKMVRFGSRCTHNASSLTRLIRGSVNLAARMVHGLLEEHKTTVSTAMSRKSNSLNSHARANIPPTTVFFIPKWATVKLMKEHTKSFIAKSISNGNKT